VLGDAEKRKAYDQFGAAGVGGGAAPGAGWRSGPGGGERVYTWRSGGGPDIPIEDWEDLFGAFSGGGRGAESNRSGGSAFDDFFGRSARRGSRRAPEPARGQDIEYPISLTFDQAVRGTTLELSIPGESGEPPHRVQVKIPPGVAEGQRIRLRGKGVPGARGGAPGDLYIVAHIQPHPYFRRINNDIYLDVPISISESVLGSKIEVPTLDGRTVVTVPAGTPCGAKLRLKSKGVKPAGNKPAGDQYVVIRIVPPKTVTDRQRELLDEFRRIGEPSPRAGVGW